MTLMCMVAGACYGPSYRDCEIECAGGKCPSGLMCELGQCRLPDGEPTCPVDVEVDAPAAVCGAIDIAATAHHTCVRRSDDSVVCWGNNDYGQTGLTSQTTCTDVIAYECNPTPTLIALPLPASTQLVGVGDYHSCAVLEDRSMWCWGDDSRTQFGDGQTGGPPDPVNVGRPDVTAIAAGDAHTCTLNSSKRVSCSGRNEVYQVGNGTNSAQPTPYEHVTPSPIKTIASGVKHTCVITEAGGVWCWGRNDFGQADPTMTFPPALPPVQSPQQITAIVGATALALGSRHTCFLTASGTLTCFGDNVSGQLSQGTTDPVSGLVAVLDDNDQVLGGAMAIAGASNHSCALKANGTVWCWGGIDGTHAGQTPLGKAAKKIAVGSSHACAILADDTVWCWGVNLLGEHGDGSHIANTAPTKALICP